MDQRKLSAILKRYIVNSYHKTKRGTESCAASGNKYYVGFGGCGGGGSACGNGGKVAAKIDSRNKLDVERITASPKRFK